MATPHGILTLKGSPVQAREDRAAKLLTSR